MAQRLFDVLISLFGLLLLSPLFLVVALWIKLDSSGPIFHRGVRVGRDGREFRVFKFRSMAADAASHGPGITAADDPRITRVGNVLRRTKIDELPQLLNIVAGDMSLVGPRPEDPRYMAYYTLEQRRVLSIRPGITSPASLHFRHEEALLSGCEWEKDYIEKVLPRKLELELEYLDRRTFLSDLVLIIRTLLALFR